MSTFAVVSALQDRLQPDSARATGSGSLGPPLLQACISLSIQLGVPQGYHLAQPETHGWGSDHRVSIFIVVYNLKQLLPPPTPGKGHPNSPAERSF